MYNLILFFPVPKLSGNIPTLRAEIKCRERNIWRQAKTMPGAVASGRWPEAQPRGYNFGRQIIQDGGSRMRVVFCGAVVSIFHLRSYSSRPALTRSG
jgi:hypothetical protein